MKIYILEVYYGGQCNVHKNIAFSKGKFSVKQLMAIGAANEDVPELIDAKDAEALFKYGLVQFGIKQVSMSEIPLCVGE